MSAPATRPLPLRVVIASQVLAAVGIFGLFFPLALTAGAAAVIGVSHGSSLTFAAGLGIAAFSVVSPLQSLISLIAAYGLDRRRPWGWTAGMAFVALILVSIGLRVLVGDEPSASDDYDLRSLALTMIPNLITPIGIVPQSMALGGAAAIFVLLALATTWRERGAVPARQPAGHRESRRRPRRITALGVLLIVLGIDALAPVLVWLARGFVASTWESGLLIWLASVTATGLALASAFGAVRLHRSTITFGPAAALAAAAWVAFWMLVVATQFLTTPAAAAAVPAAAAMFVAIATVPYSVWALLSARRAFEPPAWAAPIESMAARASTGDSGPGGLARPGRSLTRRHALLLAAVGGAVVLAAGLLLVLGRDQLGVADEGGITTPIPEAPIAARVLPSVAWTGQVLVVWSGTAPSSPGDGPEYLADGAAFEPAEEEWRSIASAPIPGRTSAVVASTDSEVIVWGGMGDADLLADGAAYDPIADTWRPIAAAPLSPRAGAAAAWTGSELVIFGGQTSTEAEVPAQDGAAYDPATDMWRPLPPAPLPAGWYHHLVWTGDEVVLFADIPMDDSLPPMHVAAWDPATDAWRVPPPPPVGFLNAALPPLWTGDRVLTIAPHIFETQHDPGTDPSMVPPPAGAYDPTNGAWEPAPYPPYELAYHAPAIWTGTEAWLPGASPGSIAAYDPTSGTWRAFALDWTLARFAPAIVWTGDTLLVWGGSEDAGHGPPRPFMDGLIYIPPDRVVEGP